MLQVRSLSCERDHRALFEELSFDGLAGNIIQVEGPNGAGKSTLLKILCGIFTEFSGEVNWHIDDAPLYLGHKPGLTDHLSVAENLIWLANLHGQLLSRERISAMLDAVGLSGYERVSAGNLSEGQRKRIGLARFYGFKNRVWVLDEPFSAIDASGVTSFETLLESHANSGGLAILTSHQPLELDASVHRLSVGVS